MTEITTEEKRLVMDSVGLYVNEKNFGDPTTPGVMYGEVMPALGKRNRFLFCEWLRNKYVPNMTSWEDDTRGDMEVGFRMYDAALVKPSLLTFNMIEYLKIYGEWGHRRLNEKES